MQEINTILTQVAVMLFIGVIGYLAGKTGFLPVNTAPYLSKIVVRITAPALVLSTLTSYDFDKKTLYDGLRVTIFAIVFMLFSLLIGRLVSNLMKLKIETASVFSTHLMFGNVGYLALPLFKAIYNERAVVLAAFYVLAYELLVWTVGIYLLDKRRGLSLKSNLKKFINVNTIACSIGLIFALVNLQQYIKANAVASFIYNIFYSTVTPIGNSTLLMVMLFTGLQMAGKPSEGITVILKNPVTLVISALKLLVIPAAALGIMLLLGDLVDPYVKTILIMDLAMPCGAIVVALASELGMDYRQATLNMIYTTVLSLFTLPIFMLLLNRL